MHQTIYSKGCTYNKTFKSLERNRVQRAVSKSPDAMWLCKFGFLQNARFWKRTHLGLHLFYNPPAHGAWYRCTDCCSVHIRISVEFKNDSSKIFGPRIRRCTTTPLWDCSPQQVVISSFAPTCLAKESSASFTKHPVCTKPHSVDIHKVDTKRI